MRVFVRTTMWVLAGVILAGCASAGGTGGSGSRDVITEEQLAEFAGSNVYEVIQRVRPAWLRVRSTGIESQADGVMVYVDGAPVSGVSELRTFQAGQVTEIRHLDAREATTRYGTGHTNGAILVTTRR